MNWRELIDYMSATIEDSDAWDEPAKARVILKYPEGDELGRTTEDMDIVDIGAGFYPRVLIEGDEEVTRALTEVFPHDDAVSEGSYGNS